MGTATYLKELNGSGTGAVYRMDPPVTLEANGQTYSWELGWISARPESSFMGIIPIPAQTAWFPVKPSILSDAVILDEDTDPVQFQEDHFDVPDNVNPPDTFVIHDDVEHADLLAQMGYEAVQYPVVAN